MLTHSDDGTPYGYDGLVDSFALRLSNLRDIAEWLPMGEKSPKLSALRLEVDFLHDDWTVFEKALGDWHEREHPEAYADTPTPTKGGAR